MQIEILALRHQLAVLQGRTKKRASICSRGSACVLSSFRNQRDDRLRSSMLKNGLQAFVTNDATAARKVIQRELEINKLYSRVFHTLLRLIVSKPAMATAHASSYSSQSTSKGLETILPTFVS